MSGITQALIGSLISSPVFVSASAPVLDASVSTLSISAPTSIQNKNLLIAFVNADDAAVNSPVVPSGWSVLLNDTANRYIATKIATASEPASYSFGFNAIVNGLVVSITNYFNAAVDVVTATSAAATNPTRTITVTENYSLLLSFASVNTASTTFGSPTPGTWTNRTLRSASPAQAVYDRNVNAGSQTITITSSSSSTRATLLSLKPA